MHHTIVGTADTLDISGGKFWPLWEFIAEESIVEHFTTNAYTTFLLKAPTRPDLAFAMGLSFTNPSSATTYTPKKCAARQNRAAPRSPDTVRRRNRSPDAAKSREQTQDKRKDYQAHKRDASSTRPASTSTTSTHKQDLCIYNLRNALGAVSYTHLTLPTKRIV